MSRTVDLLQAAYQRAGRAGVDAVVDPLDPQVEWLAATPCRTCADSSWQETLPHGDP